MAAVVVAVAKNIASVQPLVNYVYFIQYTLDDESFRR